MSTYALTIIDMQKAYFNAGDLQTQKAQLVTNANQLIQWANEARIPVFNIVTLHERDRSTWTLNMLDDNEGYLFADDADSGVVEGLNIDEAIAITKTRDSAFFETSFTRQLHDASVDTLIVLGVSTQSCILQTVADAYAHNLRVMIAKDAVASHDNRWHEPILEMVNQEYRQSVLTQHELREVMRGRQGNS